MRLIDADELRLLAIEKLHMVNPLGDITDLIDEAPTIEPCKSAEQNVADVPSGDLVSRQEAIEVVGKELQYQEENRIPYDSHDNGTCFGLKKAKELLLALPSADRPKGNSAEKEKSIERFLTLLTINALSDSKAADRPSADVVHKPDYSYEADMVKRLKEATSADRPQVNSNSAEEQIAETEQKSNRPKEDSKPEPYVPEASTERVVHCKDCIYSEEIRDGNDMLACNNMDGMPGDVRGDDFCSSGSL